VHGRPEQQSAVVVQAPPCATHVEPHTKPVSGLPTQGRPQQSALDAHGWPAWLAGSVQSTPTPTPQRGMPSASWWHVSNWSTLPAQQFAFALHSTLCRRQIAPAGEHELPLSQRPTA
jgi:hypothetical protein